MIDKETLIGLLIKTLAHWDDNIETFKKLGELESQFDWFWVNGYSLNCALCLYKKEGDIEFCADFCPLDDSGDEDDGNCTGDTCCVEWQNLLTKCMGGPPATIEDVEAMRNRIHRELDKVTTGVSGSPSKKSHNGPE